MSTSILLPKSSSVCKLPNPVPLLLLAPSPPSSIPAVVDRLSRLITSHPSELPLEPILLPHLPLFSSSPTLLPSLLSRLFSSHSPSSKSLHLLLFSLSHSLPISPLSLDTAIHTFSRSRHFSLALSLLRRIQSLSPSPSPSLSPRTLSILLSRHAKFRPFLDTLHLFRTLQDLFPPFGYPHFNALLRAYSSLGRVPEARSLFLRLHHRFPPHPSTLNTLLLGFRQAADPLAFDLFYHDALLRGFLPDVVTYNIRIDAYCKSNRFPSALHVYSDLLSKHNLSPTVRTLTTLVHGAGIAKEPARARQLFDEISQRGLVADRGAYNALMGALIRGGDFAGGVRLAEEMEEKGFDLDDVSYYTLFCGLRKKGHLEGVCDLYRRMVGKEFVPKVRTAMLLMKFFCESRRSDLGLELWRYLVEKGCCPHPHALDLLVSCLCCNGGPEAAYECFRQLVERGRRPSERSFLLLERVLRRSKERGKLEELNKMKESLASCQSSHLEDDSII